MNPFSHPFHPFTGTELRVARGVGSQVLEVLMQYREKDLDHEQA
jgi:hypothetical protein